MEDGNGYFSLYGFESKLIENKKSYFCIRNTINNQSDTEKWIEAYSRDTKSSFKIKRTQPTSRVLLFHRVWICRHGEARSRPHQPNKRNITITGCEMSIRMKIQAVGNLSKRTWERIKNDATRRESDVYPCLVEVMGIHNHPTESADALQQLYVAPETKEKFNEYFSMGMTTAQASRAHEDNLEHDLVGLANNATNPSRRAIAYLREKWMKENHVSSESEDKSSVSQNYASNSHVSSEGEDKSSVIQNYASNSHSTIKKWRKENHVDSGCEDKSPAVPKYASNSYNTIKKWMKENHSGFGGEDMYLAIQKYASDSQSTIKMEFYASWFAIALVTPFMKRIHKAFPESKEAVFVDTASQLDQFNTTVTPLLSAGPAGAAPLGVILTSSHDEKCFVSGFRMLKEVLEEEAFYGQMYPDCFITSDSCGPEQNALREVWPQSSLYVSIFCILRQVWHWLWDSSHGVKEDDREELMKVTKNLVYAESSSAFDLIWQEFLESSLAKQYDSFVRYVYILIEKKEDWNLCFRGGKLLHGHMTNILAEANMCIIKDIVVNRCKAFNTCQLVMYLDTWYDSCMKRRHLDLAHGGKKLKGYQQNQSNSFNFEILPTENLQFSVKSKKGDERYVVDMRTGTCTCPSGQTGAVCKHQVACSHRYVVMLPQTFQSTPENRQWLARVCYGEEMSVPSLEFFSTLEEGVNNSVGNFSGSSRGECSKGDVSKMQQPEPNMSDEDVSELENSDDDLVAIDVLVLSLEEYFPTSPDGVNKTDGTSSNSSIIKEKQGTGNRGESSKCDFSEMEQPEQYMKFDEVAGEMSDDKTNSLQVQNQVICNTIDMLNKLIEKYGNDETEKVLEKINERLISVKTPSMLNSALHSLLSGLSCGTIMLGTGKRKIPCQSTLVAKQSVDISRSVTAVGKGRKRKCSATEKPAKHVHNLSVDVSENQPNGKRH